MLSAIAITPCAPVLVPELAGAAATEVAGIREAALTAVAALPGRWVAVGAGDADRVIGAAGRGSYAGFGVDVPIALGPEATGEPITMPVCALWAGWLRDHASPAAAVEVRVFDRGHDDHTALLRGRSLGAELEASPERIGVLVVADGATTLTAAAPGGYDPDAVAVQGVLDDALASADPAGLTGLPAAVTGRVAFAVLAGLAGSSSWTGRELYRGAPYGVGYFVGVWNPGRPRP